MQSGSHLVAFLVLGCSSAPTGTKGSGGADPRGPIEFACELGTPDAEGAFVSLAHGGNVELILGFQGFLFLPFLARVDATASREVEAVLSMQVDGEEPWGGRQPGVSLVSDGTGRLLSEEIDAFLPSSEVAAYVGQTAQLGIRLEGSDGQCVMQGEVQLVDEDPCIHTDDEPICPDTGDVP